MPSGPGGAADPVGAAQAASQLTNWPVQLALVPPNAPYFRDADVLVAADCVAYAVADFHARLLAGKIAGIRPVQGTRLASVAAAVRHFDANLLVVEHAFGTYHETRMMIRTFVLDRGVAGAKRSLLEAVAQQERTQ